MLWKITLLGKIFKTYMVKKPMSYSLKLPSLQEIDSVTEILLNGSLNFSSCFGKTPIISIIKARKIDMFIISL